MRAHYCRFWQTGGLLVVLLLAPPITSALDMGRNAGAVTGLHRLDILLDVPGKWIRLRGVQDWSPGKQATRIDEEENRQSLRQLRATGFRVCVLLCFDRTSWRKTQASGGSREHLPLDLREVFERCRQLQKSYGDLVDAWEIENEPDIGFVPENAEIYTAYLKASYLGFKSDAALTRLDMTRPSQARDSLVLMAPLALPPGPWFELFVANDGLSYTDGFNYHYYGYAEDFSSVHEAHRNAVSELAGKNQVMRSHAGSTMVDKSLPIFVTELGYALLSEKSRNTKQGRLDQWCWFRDIGLQLPALGIEAPIAFYAQPYLENGVREFGLTVPSESGRKKERWVAGGIAFGPDDFGVRDPQPWMGLIGEKLGSDETTPALAWWLRGQPRRPSPISWPVRVPAPSPLVIDLLAGEDTVPIKRYGGYVLRGRPSEGGRAIGQAALVLYNFSERSTRGKLNVPGNWLINCGPEIELLPFDRREIPVSISVSNQSLVPEEVRVEFQPIEYSMGPGELVTRVWPTGAGIPRQMLADLAAASVPRERAAAILRARSLAVEEPVKVRVGEWFLPKGISIERRQEGFVIKVAPDVPRKVLRVEAELAWPDSVDFPSDGFLSAEFRLNGRSNPDEFEELYIQVRAENGGLYGVTNNWVLQAKRDWSPFLEHHGNLTLWFYGPAGKIWRFADTKPVSLAFVLFPKALPAEYEFRRVHLIRIGKATEAGRAVKSSPTR